MKNKLYIIVSCTDRKRIRAPRDLRLRTIRGFGASRVGEWKDRLRCTETDLLRAADMYIGPHWATALSLPDIARNNGYSAELWVASAGYGLIPANVNIKPYSATFSARHADSIIATGARSIIAEGCAIWWRQLSRWKGPEGGYPRTIEGLVGNDPNSAVMIVASPPYLTALSVDLEAAKEQMNDRSRLLLVSAGMNQYDGLISNLLPVSAKLQHVVNGSTIGLNTRIARKILEESHRWPLDFEVLNHRYSTLTARLPERKRYERELMTDTEVEKYIRSALRANRDETATGALRKLRDGGRACEQKRFGRLFKKINK